MSRDPSVFQWTEVGRCTRTRKRGGKAYVQSCVRAKCSCGTVRVMPLSDFEAKKTLCCNACRLARSRAEGWASPRQVRTRNQG